MGTTGCTCSHGNLHKDTIVEAKVSVKDQLRRQRSSVRKGTEDSLSPGMFSSEKSSMSSASTAAGSDSDTSASDAERKPRPAAKSAEAEMADFKEHMKKYFASRDAMSEAFGDNVDLAKFQDFLVKAKLECADGGKRLFAHIDKNSDGVLTRQELVDALKMQAPAAPTSKKDLGEATDLATSKSSAGTLTKGKTQGAASLQRGRSARRMSVSKLSAAEMAAACTSNDGSKSDGPKSARTVKRRGSTCSMASAVSAPAAPQEGGSEEDSNEAADEEKAGAAPAVEDNVITRFKATLKAPIRKKAWEDFLFEHRNQVDFRDFSRLLDVKLGHDKAYATELWAEIDSKKEGVLEGSKLKEMFADEVPVVEKESKPTLSRKKSSVSDSKRRHSVSGKKYITA